MKIQHWILVISVAIIGILGATVRFWAGPIYYIPSGAMKPTLNINDRIVVASGAYRTAGPAHNDIALMNLPNSLLMGSGKGSTIMVKRVVGVPGDRIEIVDGTLKINGKVQSEPFASWKEGRYSIKIIKGVVYSRDLYKGQESEWTVKGTIPPAPETIDEAPTEPIPAQKYLVLGDNRGNSNDSHVFGLIDRKQFTGRVTMKIWPTPQRF